MKKNTESVIDDGKEVGLESKHRENEVYIDVMSPNVSEEQIISIFVVEE
jgi:hypothetical protein